MSRGLRQKQKALNACIVLGLAAGALWLGSRISHAEPDALRVCADPNNRPFSKSAGEGVENKIAEIVAKELGRRLTYLWWAQRRGWYRNTLKAEACDVMMGVPTALDLVSTTRPYYRSTYVFVYRADRHLNLTSIKDSRLHYLKIGVHLIGSDGYNTPPAHVLGQEGIVQNVKGYPIYGDYREPDPPARIIEAVENGDLDIAAVWGPLGGYAAQHSPVPLTVVPIGDAESFARFKFQYDISMGVRKGNRALKDELDTIIARRVGDFRSILTSYGIPIVSRPSDAASVPEESEK